VTRVYNPSSMRRRFIALLAILLLALGVPGTAATRITISTGPWGGVYFLVGTAMAHLLSKYIPGATAIAEPATGSAHSLEFVHRGEATIGLVGLASAHFGVRGQREFDKKYDNVGFVMAAMDSGQSIVTLADSGVRAFGDVRGLHVGVNAPASKTQLLAALKLYGINEGNLRLSVMSYTEQLAALREGTIDAAFIALSPYNPDLAAFASAQPIRILGLDAARAKTFDESPFWTPVTLLGRTYQGQDRDLLVPGAHSTLVANKQADPELIYQIVKTIVERNREFADLHPGGRDFTIAKTRMFVEQNLVPMAFHPGAERYWREKGVLK
jgi:TRAP transporter TAXI family solute receptor